MSYKDNLLGLFALIYNDDLEGVKKMIDADPSMLKSRVKGETPLHIAAEQGCKEIVEFLVRKSADVGAKNNVDETPLHKAALYGEKGIMKILLQSGAYVDAKDGFGKTPFHIAARYADEGSCDALLKNGADINAADKDGKTALHQLFNYGDTYFAEYLLDQGIVVDALDNYGKAAIDYAYESGNDKAVATLRMYGSEIELGEEKNAEDSNIAALIAKAEAAFASADESDIIKVTEYDSEEGENLIPFNDQPEMHEEHFVSSDGEGIVVSLHCYVDIKVPVETLKELMQSEGFADASEGLGSFDWVL